MLNVECSLKKVYVNRELNPSKLFLFFFAFSFFLKKKKITSFQAHAFVTISTMDAFPTGIEAFEDSIEKRT